MLRRLVLVGLLALALPSQASGFTRNAELERFASKVAMRPAQVRCPDKTEWGAFVRENFGGDPELVYGVTHLTEDWIMVRYDLCDAALRVADESVAPSLRALAVLALEHEAYHVRAWGWRRDEAKVECRAIRRFTVAAQLLGASLAQAQRLYWHATVWHYGIAQPGSAYYSPSCQVP